MYLTARVRLYPTPEQASLLIQTIERFNSACNFASEMAFSQKTFCFRKLHHLVYRKARELFSLPSVIAIEVAKRVAESYKTNRSNLHRFRKRGAMVYHPQAYRFHSAKGVVSLSTLAGRVVVPFVLKYPRHITPQQFKRVTCQLVYQNGKFFLLVPVEVPESPSLPVGEFLGVDLGIVNLAADSDGHRYSGEIVRRTRAKQMWLVSHLQRKAEEKKKQGKRPKSIRRVLKRISRRVHNFVTTVNHTVSKSIVARAKDTRRGIAVEELSGIRCRATASAHQRRELHSWSFQQLRAFIEYKARLAGVVVVAVNPHNTSITCPQCNHVGRENRPSRDTFICARCGLAGPADVIAAKNIAFKATTRWPHAAPMAVASVTSG